MKNPEIHIHIYLLRCKLFEKLCCFILTHEAVCLLYGRDQFSVKTLVKLLGNIKFFCGNYRFIQNKLGNSSGNYDFSRNTPGIVKYTAYILH